MNAFVGHFITKGIKEDEAIELFYLISQELLLRKSEILTPQDDIATKYGIVDEDLDDLALAVAKIFRRKLPTSREEDFSNVTAIKTVEDLVEWVLSQPENPASS